MTAVREQILALVHARLAGLPGVAECEREASGDPTSFPSLAIYDQGQEIGEAEAGQTRYVLEVVIEGYVSGGNGLTASAELNDLYAQVVAELLPEPPLDGLAETIEEGRMRVAVAQLSSARRLGFTLPFLIQFSTRRGDPAAI